MHEVERPLQQQVRPGHRAVLRQGENLGGLGEQEASTAPQLSLSLTNPGHLRAKNDLVWSGAIGAGLTFGSGPGLPRHAACAATVDGCSANVRLRHHLDDRERSGQRVADLDLRHRPRRTKAAPLTWKRSGTRRRSGSPVTYNSPPRQPTNTRPLQRHPGLLACVQGARRGRLPDRPAPATSPARQRLGPGRLRRCTPASASTRDWSAREPATTPGTAWSSASDNILSDAQTRRTRGAVAALHRVAELSADGSTRGTSTPPTAGTTVLGRAVQGRSRA